jgi:hypothetical protein
LHALTHFLRADRKTVFLNKQVQGFVEIEAVQRSEIQINFPGIDRRVKTQLAEHVLFDGSFHLRKGIGAQKHQRRPHQTAKTLDAGNLAFGSVLMFHCHRVAGILQAAVDILEHLPQ